MTTDIFIVSYKRDFSYLEYCLRSIDKFCNGFNALRILVPNQDVLEANQLVNRAMKRLPFFVEVLGGNEWPGKGMLWHLCQIMRADEWCPDADFILHFDSDCIFTLPITPETFFKDGKPILRYETWESIGKRRGDVLIWKPVVEACLPFPVPYETMRCHPAVHCRGLYRVARDLIETKTQRPVDFYIRNSGQNQWPQKFCEFITLGNVAMVYFKERYYLWDCSKNVFPDWQEIPVQQFWSHSLPDKPQQIWVDGYLKDVVPIQMINQILGTP